MSVFQLFHLILLLKCVIQRFPVVESVTGTPAEKAGHMISEKKSFPSNENSGAFQRPAVSDLNRTTAGVS